MKKIVQYIRLYSNDVNKPVLLCATIFTAIFIFCNYHFKLDRWIIEQPFYLRLFYRYCISLTAFLVPYCLFAALTKKPYFSITTFTVILFIAPIIFSLKMEIYTHLAL